MQHYMIYVHKITFIMNICSLLHFVQNIYIYFISCKLNYILSVGLYIFLYMCAVYAIVFNGMYILRQLAHHITFNCSKFCQTIPIVL